MLLGFRLYGVILGVLWADAGEHSNSTYALSDVAGDLLAASCEAGAVLRLLRSTYLVHPQGSTALDFLPLPWWYDGRTSDVRHTIDWYLSSWHTCLTHSAPFGNSVRHVPGVAIWYKGRRTAV